MSDRQSISVCCTPDRAGEIPAWAEPCASLLQALPEAAWLKDRDSRYLAVNDAFLRLLAGNFGTGEGGAPRTREAIVGRTDRELFSTPLAEEYRTLDLQVLREEHEHVHTREVGQGGEAVRWVEIRRTPFRNAAGCVIGILGVERDVTEQRTREPLEAALSRLTHEMSGPINTILNFSQLLLMDARPEDGEALRIVQREAERAVEVVAELRRIARAADGASPDDDPASPARAECRPRPLRPLRVLVVDDETSIRSSVQRFLERRGHRVDAVGNGAQALALLGTSPGAAPYDVVLCDLRMPGMGGEQLLQIIRERSDGLGSRVVLMTGDDTCGATERVLASTGNPALVKPVPLQEVARVVEGVGASAVSRV